MSDQVLHLAIIVLIAVFVIVLAVAVRRFLSEYRRHARVSAPMEIFETLSSIDISANEHVGVHTQDESSVMTRVRILAFSSEEDRQCRILQAPVLRRIIEARGNVVAVINVDVPSSPELTQRYNVLTVPTTVLLDATGKTYAVNYGFTNAQSLLKQIDEILALDGAQEALS